MRILASLDDIYVLGPPDAAAEATKALREEFNAINLEFNTTKCKAWIPSGNYSTLADPATLGFELQRCDNGLKVLGVYVGSDAARRVLEALTDTSKDKSLVKKVECLKEFAKTGYDHYALALLLCCVAPSVNRVLRCANPADAVETAGKAKADELHIDASGELKSGSRARTQLQMRQKDGGLCMSSAAERAKTAYLASWAAVGPSVAARWPHLAADILALCGEGGHPHAYGHAVAGCGVAACREAG